MNDLYDFLLKKKKRSVLEKKNIRNTLINKNFTTYRKDELCFVRSSHVRDTHILYDYYCQHGHMKRECYVKINMYLGMKTIWVLKDKTKPYRSKNKWLPIVSSLI